MSGNTLRSYAVPKPRGEVEEAGMNQSEENYLAHMIMKIPIPGQNKIDRYIQRRERVVHSTPSTIDIEITDISIKDSYGFAVNKR